MMWKNSHRGYGWVAILFHWLTFVSVAGLFALGLYMVELDYYDQWYHRGPWVHKSVGMLLLGLVLCRLFWKLISAKPHPLGASLWLNRCIDLLHWFIYLLLLLICVSGYLIAAANGDSISIFDWISLPGLNAGIENQEDIAGEIHEISAWLLATLVVLHAAGAIKHHFGDRDDTLKRMLRARN